MAIYIYIYIYIYLLRWAINGVYIYIHIHMGLSLWLIDVTSVRSAMIDSHKSISLSLSLALQPSWSLAAFQFHNPIHHSWDSLDGGSARRKAATYTQNNTNTE
jgi:hypothetical protein